MYSSCDFYYITCYFIKHVIINVEPTKKKKNASIKYLNINLKKNTNCVVKCSVVLRINVRLRLNNVNDCRRLHS